MAQWDIEHCFSCSDCAAQSSCLCAIWHNTRLPIACMFLTQVSGNESEGDARGTKITCGAGALQKEHSVDWSAETHFSCDHISRLNISTVTSNFRHTYIFDRHKETPNKLEMVEEKFDPSTPPFPPLSLLLSRSTRRKGKTSTKIDPDPHRKRSRVEGFAHVIPL